MRRHRWVIGLAAVLSIVGCDAAATKGSIHGTITMTGGPHGAAPAAAAGTVVVTRKGRQVGKKKVAQGAEFRFDLVSGAYRVSVEGVNGACETVGVTVRAGADQAVPLTCQRK